MLGYSDVKWLNACRPVPTLSDLSDATEGGMLRAAAQILPGLVWIANGDGSLDWCSAAWSRLVGFAATQAGTLSGLLYCEDRDAYDRKWACGIATGVEFEANARISSPDGQIRWHRLRCAPAVGVDNRFAWVGTATDIDAEITALDTLIRDNRELEQDIFTQLHELNRSRSRLQTIFDACPDHLSLLRLAKSGQVTFENINPAAEAIYDCPLGQIAGRRVDEVGGIESAASLENHVRRTLRDGRLTYELQRCDGNKPLHLQVVSAPLAYSNEEEGLVLFCGRDITEQRAAEEALRQSQKMEAVGQLTGGLAHDFNNLLTGIMGSLDLLQARVRQGRFERVDHYVAAAQEAAGRAAALTHRLLAFSRRQTLDPKASDVNALISGMEDLLRRTVGPEISVTNTRADDLWTVLVDVSQLENALLNLCINARDAMPDGGRIEIGTRNVRLVGEKAAELQLPAGDFVSLSVSDDGTGMPPEVAERIFDPFFTTKPLGSGTGLGLSMIYGFAQQSGGNVEVDTSPGAGTTMRILLPRHFGVAEQDAPHASFLEAPRSAGGETILLVDDERIVRSLVAEVLTDLGYAMTVAADGREAMNCLQTPARYDVLVTDVGLPGGLNGRQVADYARALRPDIKVLFITGYAETAVLSQDHLASGMQIITKPFAMEALASRVKDLIGGP